jgi:hypothetical protein
MGVAVAKFHTPCRSGSPWAVRSGAWGFAAAAAFGCAGAVPLVWPAAGTATRHAKMTAVNPPLVVTLCACILTPV